ncbi:MAG: GSU3473 family protein [Desulfuromonadaceae bacterium]
MLIRVKYVDERFDMVRPEILDRLLEAGKVREFQRSDGWVMPGISSLRHKKDRDDYSGTDRRRRQGAERRAPG